MSTDLQTTETPVVADVTDELQLVARTPGEMKIAQASLAGWCRHKVEIAEKDAADMAESLHIAINAGFKIGPLERQERIARKRVDFYRKVQAAVEAGYCIVPNLPVDVFAIRTRKNSPRFESSTQRNLQESEAPPLGDGSYVNSEPKFGSYTTKAKNWEGKEYDQQRFTPQDFQDVEFPISVATPLVMSATVEAMALRCFDELGILPERRGKGDPIVVGIIKQPGRRPVSFLIAWYVDTGEI